MKQDNYNDIAYQETSHEHYTRAQTTHELIANAQTLCNGSERGKLLLKNEESSLHIYFQVN